ncbi:unnamed protein product, partial [Rotaria magnacalcarata]
ITAAAAGVKKHSLSIDNDKKTIFSYYEK